MFLQKANPYHDPKTGRFSTGPTRTTSYRASTKSILRKDGRIDEAVAKDLAAELIQDSKSGEYPYPLFTGFDSSLAVARKSQGFDGPPSIIEDSKFDEYNGKKISNGDKRDSQTLYRGDKQKQYADELLTGPYFPGTGVSCNGTYSSGDRDYADKYAGREGVVQRFKLHPRSRVANFHDLVDQRYEFHVQLAVLEDAKRISPAEYMVLKDFAHDAGRVATMMGYDAIHLNSETTVILNRTAMIFSDTPVVDYSASSG